MKLQHQRLSAVKISVWFYCVFCLVAFKISFYRVYQIEFKLECVQTEAK